MADQRSLNLGEIGPANVSVRQNVSRIEQRLTTNALSQVSVDIIDPGLVMFDLGYFVLDRELNFNDYAFRITDVTLHWKFDQEIISVVAKANNGVRMMGDKGGASFGKISPTAFAQAKAAEFGMEFFGEPTAVGAPILREQDERTDESTWDVLSRLAKENDFNLFESKNKLFFASDQYIVDTTDSIKIKVPKSVSDFKDVEFSDIQTLSVDVRQSNTDRFGARADLRFAKNDFSTGLLPGNVIEFEGLGSYDEFKFLVENVSFGGEKQSQVRITTRSDREPIGGRCEVTTFKRGDFGECVKRIQYATGTTPTGEFGPVTEANVKKFQKARGLSQTGIVDSETWEKIATAEADSNTIELQNLGIL